MPQLENNLPAALISKINSSKLSNIVDQVKVVANKDGPSTLQEYHLVEKIMAKYDLNSVALQRGEIFSSVLDLYNKCLPDIPYIGPIHLLTTPQLTRLCFLLICVATKTTFLSFHSIAEEIEETPIDV